MKNTFASKLLRSIGFIAILFLTTSIFVNVDILGSENGRQQRNERVFIEYNGSKIECVKGEVLLQVKTENLSEINKVITGLGGIVTRPFDYEGFGKIQFINLSDDDIYKTILSTLKSEPDVVYAEPNIIRYIQQIWPNDPFLSYQWGLEKIDAYNGWSLNTGNQNTKIAILDTGIDNDHPDLYTKIVTGWNVLTNNVNTSDYHGHGTHVAGIAAAASNNAVGIAGIAWECKILPIKVCNYESVEDEDLRDGIYKAIELGARILSISISSDASSNVLESACQYAYNNGAVIICCSGNEGESADDHIGYPARYATTMAIGASTYLNIRSDFSNHGPELDVIAPGSMIYSTWKDNDYRYLDGTSQATPYVSGLCGLLLSAHPELSNLALMWLIRKTAVDLHYSVQRDGWVEQAGFGKDKYTGYGIINVKNSLFWPNNPYINGCYTQGVVKLPAYASHLRIFKGETYNGVVAQYNLECKYPYPTGNWLLLSYVAGTESTFTHNISIGDNPIAYRAKECDVVGRYSGYGNTLILYAPPQGDPIVATTQSPEATAYSNGRKIAIDDNGTLHVTYTSGDSIYYTTSTDQGETWTPGEAVAMGQNPALALKADGTPQLCWNEGSNVYTSEKSGGTWGGTQLVYAGSPGEDISYLSFVADPQSGKTYSGWVGTQDGHSQVLVAERTPGNPIQPAPERIDFGEVAFKSPCLALKRDGTLLNAWSKDGVVRFREGDGSIMELSQPGRHCIHPMVESYGDRVTVVWQEALDSARAKGLEPGRHRIVSKTRTEYGWEEEKVIAFSDPSTGSGGDYQYPVAAAAGQYLYAGHHGDGNYDIHYLGEYANGWETHTRNITINSGGQSGYPCVAFSNRWPEHALYVLWTEAFPESAKGIYAPPLVKDYRDVIQPVPHLEVYPRTDQASAYCTQRAGGLCYGAGAYMTVDYHPQELKYRFEGLNPDNRYKVKMAFYRSTGGGARPSNNWLLMPKCDQVSFGTVHLPDTTVVSIEREIPGQCLADGATEITIRKVKGEYAVCASLEIYEYTYARSSRSGGAQTAGFETPQTACRYELMPCAPNPFGKTTSISYQLAKPGRVTLKVYNTLGQLVRTLEDGEKPAGNHLAKWDGRDGNGQPAANGVYLYRLEAGGYNKTLKMTLVR